MDFEAQDNKTVFKFVTIEKSTTFALQSAFDSSALRSKEDVTVKWSLSKKQRTFINYSL